MREDQYEEQNTPSVLVAADSVKLNEDEVIECTCSRSMNPASIGG